MLESTKYVSRDSPRLYGDGRRGRGRHVRRIRIYARNSETVEPILPWTILFTNFAARRVSSPLPDRRNAEC